MESRNLSHGLKKIWEDVPEVILVGRRWLRPVSRSGGALQAGLRGDRRPPNPSRLAGRSDLTAFLSSDIFPHRWLKRLGFGYGAGAVMEDDRWKMADGKWKMAGLTAVKE